MDSSQTSDTHDDKSKLLSINDTAQITALWVEDLVQYMVITDFADEGRLMKIKTWYHSKTHVQRIVFIQLSTCGRLLQSLKALIARPKTASFGCEQVSLL